MSIKEISAESVRDKSWEGDHWKLHIHPDHIKVLGNENLLSIQPVTFDERLKQ